jgi:PHD/YefM family antitoxin component YafN of YafNO toxin-antitoxin module
MMSLKDFNAWQETVYLRHLPANARDLLEAVANFEVHRNLVKRDLKLKIS